MWVCFFGNKKSEYLKFTYFYVRPHFITNEFIFMWFFCILFDFVCRSYPQFRDSWIEIPATLNFLKNTVVLTNSIDEIICIYWMIAGDCGSLSYPVSCDIYIYIYVYFYIWQKWVIEFFVVRRLRFLFFRILTSGSEFRRMCRHEEFLMF